MGDAHPTHSRLTVHDSRTMSHESRLTNHDSRGFIMCGIVGAVGQRNVVPILLEGLKRLEYRGYDSAGLAVVNGQDTLQRLREVGKVAALVDVVERQQAQGATGVAHTRWATHGAPTTDNAHPHLSHDCIAVVHNGIIENHDELREQLKTAGYEFYSDTDTEVIAHLIYDQYKQSHDLLQAVQTAVGKLKGAFALGIVSREEPKRLVAAREGCPLVIGVGVGENYIASDCLALAPVTDQVVYLSNGDVVDLKDDAYVVYDRQGKKAERKVHTSQASADAVDRGEYRNYTQKEIFEQPHAVAETLEARVSNDRVLDATFGINAAEVFDQTKAVQIIACGTSYHAGLVAKHWLECLAGIPCNVEVASEFRYRKHVVPVDTLVVSVSQSGETADTLAALQMCKELGFAHTLAICNVAESSLVRESELVFLTQAGPEIGVASTKAFTTQLVSLLLLTLALARRHGLSAKEEKRAIDALKRLPGQMQQVLELDDEIKDIADGFADKDHALFLGRGVHYPIAMEGALKLKEISYIHAEAYPAGELKHGPLALVDAKMPVVAVAPNDELLEKLKSNFQEVKARGGELLVFSERGTGVRPSSKTKVRMPKTDDLTSPILYVLPLQLLAYHVAMVKGTDVDQPRNLAKSVTVE